MKYKIKIAYDGKEYSGFQIQPNGHSIQETIEKVLSKISSEKISIVGSSRTDAGVHANGQVAHFIYQKSNLSLKSINSLLPNDIRIISLEEVSLDFHARYSAKEKIYHYHITTDKVQSPFERGYCLHYTFPIDIEKLLAAIPYFIGTKNFSSFANELSPNKNPVKTIYELSFIKTKSGFILKFRGDGFLYKMVRNITGTLLDIARGKINFEILPLIFEKKSRVFAGKTAPPHALFLETIVYNEFIM
jgi:tRNA pseudouridine38-40 synthase